MKVTAILIISAVVLSQAVARNSVSPRSAKDDVKKLYNELMEIVDKAVTEAEDTVNKGFQAVKDAATTLETSAKSEIQGALDALQSKMDDLNQKAADAGIDLTPCKQFETEFDQIPDTLMDDLTQCVNDKITQAQNIVNDALTNIKTVEEDYKNIESDIDNCGGGLKAVKCYAKLLEKIEKDTTGAPKEIANDIAKATEFCTTLETSLEECAVGKVEKVGELGAEYILEFATCAGLNV